jgi:hypothetical protein
MIRLIVARRCRCLARTQALSNRVQSQRRDCKYRFEFCTPEHSKRHNLISRLPHRVAVSDGNSLKSAQRLKYIAFLYIEVRILAPQPASTVSAPLFSGV